MNQQLYSDRQAGPPDKGTPRAWALLVILGLPSLAAGSIPMSSAWTLTPAESSAVVQSFVASGVETHDPAVAKFVELARAGTFQYMDRSLAIADGYRLIGTDFPGMGEHWVNPGLIMKGDFDPAHPQVLCYTTVNGEATLTSVA